MDFIINGIFRNSPILLGIISMIGLIVQKKNVSDVIKGGLLAAFGMVILDAGVGMLIGSISPINEAFKEITNTSVSTGLNDITFTETFGASVGIAMFLGLILHLLIARFTPFKVIFLTGHMLWWFPFIFIAGGVEGGLSGIPLIIFASICSAIYWSIMPFLLKKYVFAVTSDTSFTLGHPSGFLSLASGFVASKFGNKSKSTEDFKLPKAFSFFREISITGGFVVFLMFIAIYFITRQSSRDGLDFIIDAISKGLKFGAGLIVMLHGVRMLVNQIVPAFKGISEKIIPNAIPALDCPIIFNYKPNAVLFGFITAMITSTILIIICNYFNVFGILLIPLVITSFFECGTAAVIGEGQGGVKGAIIGSIVAGSLMVFLVGVSAIVFSETIQNWVLIFGGNDLSLFGIIAKFIASIFGGI